MLNKRFELGKRSTHVFCRLKVLRVRGESSKSLEPWLPKRRASPWICPADDAQDPLGLPNGTERSAYGACVSPE